MKMALMTRMVKNQGVSPAVFVIGRRSLTQHLLNGSFHLFWCAVLPLQKSLKKQQGAHL